MHRDILSITNSSITIDHKDHNGLNNRKNNLRVCTTSNNNGNKRKCESKCSSLYKGVNKEGTMWRARIMVKGTSIHIGRFNTEVKAATEYNKAAIKYFGEFACVNTIRNNKC